MYFYYILTFVILTNTLSSYIDRRFSNVFAFMSMFVMAFFSALRWERGTDWLPYLDIFESVQKNIEVTSVEYGFLYYIKFLNFITYEYSFYMVVTTVIIYVIFFVALRKLSIDLNLSLFSLWCLHISIFFWVRQTIAVAIVYLALTYLIDRRPIKYFLCIITASLFHLSALIFLLVWFLKDEIRAKNIFYLILLLVGFLAFVQFFLSDAFYLKYLLYLEEGYDESIVHGVDGGAALFLPLANRIALILLFWKIIDRNSFANILLMRIYIASLPIYLASEFAFSIFGRLLVYFDLAAIILIPAAISSRNRIRWRNVVYLLLFLPYLISRYHRAINGLYVDLFVPYKWIFDKSLPVILY